MYSRDITLHRNHTDVVALECPENRLYTLKELLAFVCSIAIPAPGSDATQSLHWRQIEQNDGIRDRKICFALYQNGFGIQPASTLVGRTG